MRGEPDDAVAFADRLFPILDAPHEDVVVERFPAFVDDDDGGRAIEPVLDPVEEIHHGRRADGGIVQDLRHVEADSPHGKVGRVHRIVEQPGALALPPPWAKPRPQIPRLRTPIAPEQLDQMAQAPEIGRRTVIGVDCILDPPDLLEIDSASQLRQPFDQELAIGRRIAEHQRIETGGQSGTQYIVTPANRSHEQFGAAVLVEEHDPGIDLTGLRQEEVQDDGLTRARRADDGEVTQIALVEVEIIGARGGRLEQGDGLPPVIALFLAQREIMTARQPGEIGRGYQAPPGNIFEVARKLRPKGGFECNVLAYGDNAQFRERGLYLGNAGIDLSGRVAAHPDRHMMFAKGGTTGSHLVLGLRQVRA